MSADQSLPKRFSQLRWKLTLTYTGVTVGALLTLEAFLLGILGISIILLLNSGFLQARLIEDGTAQLTPALRSFLSQSPPDQEGIADWLDWVGTMQSYTIPLSFDPAEIIIVGPDRTMLGVMPSDMFGANKIGQQLDPQAIPGLAEPLQAALMGDEEIEHLYTLGKPGEKVVMVMSVWDADHEQVLGAMIAMDVVPTLASIINEVVPVLGVSLLIFTIIAGLAGTAYGFLVARGLVGRFDKLSEATRAWSQGNFTLLVDDTSGDELGELARRLNRMAQELQNLLDTRRELAVMEERNRLARDLHDSAKQQAFAIAAQLDAVQTMITKDPLKAASHVSESVRLVDQLRSELTGIIQELRPAVLDNKGLVPALRDYVTDWSRQNEITNEVRVQGVRLLHLEIEQALFRIMQEALANIARHSGANHVDLLLIYNKRKITLTIEDDGQGIERIDYSGGLGLRSMDERAESLGGTLEIKSVPGRGTRLTCVLPLETEMEDQEIAHGKTDYSVTGR